MERYEASGFLLGHQVKGRMAGAVTGTDLLHLQLLGQPAGEEAHLLRCHTQGAHPGLAHQVESPHDGVDLLGGKEGAHLVDDVGGSGVAADAFSE